MRLLVITNLFYPDRGGGASVFSDLCFGLADLGWSVTVFGTHPYYPEWKRTCSGNPWRLTREVIHGVEVWRHALYVPASPSRFVSRLVYEVSFSLSLLRSTWRGGPYDAVMVFCPLLGSVVFAALRKWCRSEPLWLNVQDIPTDAAAVSGISRSGVFNTVANSVQRWLFNHADVWSSISPLMVDRLSDLRRRKQPLHLCPNWLNGSLADCIASIPDKVGRPPSVPPRLLYAGNIGKKQGLLEVCRNLAKTNLPFHFQIQGDGGEAEPLRTWVVTTGDTRFSFGGFLDEPGFAQALHDADVFVITEKPGVGASFIPSKLIPGIASGTPIFAVCDRGGPLGREMTEAGLGAILEWKEMENLPRALQLMTQDLPGFHAVQRRCLGHAQIYSREVAIRRFADLLRGMAPRRP